MPAKRQNKDRAYHILGRELSAKLDKTRIARSLVVSETKISESVLKAACAGTRALPAGELAKFAKITAQEGEDHEVYLEFLREINRPGASITQILRGSNAKLKIGYIDSPPFTEVPARKGTNYPSGVLVELIELYLQLVGAQWEWHYLPFQDITTALEKREVDIITGFILETPSRQTRADFLPLDMPFAIGINGVTRCKEIQKPLTHLEFSDKLSTEIRRGDGQYGIVTVEGELADEYFPAIFPDFAPTTESKMTVTQAIHHYLDADANKNYNIVFADSMTCSRLATPPSNLVLDKPVGQFRGGFLLPLYDPEWADYFSASFYSFLRARLPQVGHIFLKASRDLAPFVQVTRAPLLPNYEENCSSHEHENTMGRFWTIEPWLNTFWPREVPVPDAFDQIIIGKKTS